MPVYEYQCKKCRKEFEYMQRMADAPKKKCEACGGALERLISQTSFQLKGSGWYKDLYSSTKPAAATESGSDASAGADKSTEAKAGVASDSAAVASDTKDKPAKAEKSDKPEKKKKAK